MSLSITAATVDDAAAIAALRTAAAESLTREFGKGTWSAPVSEKSVHRMVGEPGVFVARDGATLLATFRLGTRKPWAIDTAHFTGVAKPLYLTEMAVQPDRQRQGIGLLAVEEASRIARSWLGNAIRLDAYDAAAGAGSFYAKCGYREVGRVTYRNVPLIYYELLL